jgi:hypothetical protein
MGEGDGIAGVDGVAVSEQSRAPEPRKPDPPRYWFPAKCYGWGWGLAVYVARVASARDVSRAHGRRREIVPAREKRGWLRGGCCRAFVRPLRDLLV